jgi:hypothetical protein
VASRADGGVPKCLRCLANEIVLTIKPYLHRNIPKSISSRDQSPLAEVVVNERLRKPRKPPPIEHHGAKDRGEMRGGDNLYRKRLHSMAQYRANDPSEARFFGVSEQRAQVGRLCAIADGEACLARPAGTLQSTCRYRFGPTDRDPHPAPFALSHGRDSARTALCSASSMLRILRARPTRGEQARAWYSIRGHAATGARR